MQEMAKTFTHQEVEERLTRFWEENRFFKTDISSDKIPFTVVMPPPNVTGALHMGHALDCTLQDILIRWKRMCGDEVLWVPGVDHAGIATQTVVERHLLKTTGKPRTHFSREEFLQEIWKWKDSSEQQVISQVKKMGSSCNWDYFAFTMDPPRSKAVRTLFKKMYDAGLIYRAYRLINWDPILQTAISDDEVDYEEQDSFLYYIRYQIEGSNQFITIATSRPETLLGDTAIAVSPQDTRYQNLIGKRAVIPLAVKGVKRAIPIIGDLHVDFQFGTGALKVTPAHDPNDYEIAERHGLAFINIMTPDGRLNENGGEYAGMFMEEARKKIAEHLKAASLLEKKEPYRHRVGISSRSKAVVEPYLSKQWFVKLSAFKETLLNLVHSKQVRLIPETFESTYFHWIHNLHDWCISRQLWWGHQIPIWYSKKNPDRMICSSDEEPPPEVKQNPSEWVQDPDVLDTWFSSALWPLSVLGWPENREALQKFFPTSVLITGHDILFFWVARMMMVSEFVCNKPPFKDVFLHGLIFGKSYWRMQKDGTIAYLSAKEKESYDLGAPLPSEVHTKWEKMSKSKGNILNPLDIIEKFGTDGMRMALSSSTTGAWQIDLDLRRFEECKNFISKVWNGARFVLMNLENANFSDGINRSLLALEDLWILSRLSHIIQEVSGALFSYSFDQAATLTYDFFWKEFCAYYVELAKPVLFGKQGGAQDKINKQKILTVVLCSSLRLLHPITPFITEELFQLLKEKVGTPPLPDEIYLRETLLALQAPACAVSSYPKLLHPTDQNPEIEETFAKVHSLVHAIRQIRAEMQIPPGSPSSLIIVAESHHLKFVKEHEPILRALVKLETIDCSTTSREVRFASTAIVGPFKLILPLPPELKEKEKIRLVKTQEKLIQEQQSALRQLANPDFTAKAPAHLVEKLRMTANKAEKELGEISKQLEQLNE